MAFRDRRRRHDDLSSFDFGGGERSRKAIGLGAMAVIEDLQSTTVAFEIREKHGRVEIGR